MIPSKACVICEIPLNDFQGRAGYQLCGSPVCEGLLRNHLLNKLTCCRVCGRPIKNKSQNDAVASACYRAECLSRLAFCMGSEAAVCRICGVGIRIGETGYIQGVCCSPFCQDWESNNLFVADQRARTIRLQKRRDDLEEKVFEHLSEFHPELSEDKSIKTVVLPFLAHELSPPSVDRIANVRAGFLELAESAYAQGNHLTTTPESTSNCIDIEQSTQAPDEEIELRFARLNGSACGTCGGLCCNLGGDHAFLNASKFAEVFAARPDTGPEEIIDEYIAKIPTETFQDSCIFHGLHGCGLTKKQRSITCNTYLCSSLQTLRKLVDDNSSSFYLAATNLRDDRNDNLAVYRIKLARDGSEKMLLHATGDRTDTSGSPILQPDRP